MEIFNKEFSEINKIIENFNIFLDKDYKISLLDIKKDVVKIVHNNWTDWGFPNNQTSGVYFLFGKNDLQNGLYVGKASMSSKTSDRIYQHFSSQKNDSHFTKDGYIIDYVASIDLETIKIPFIAPALEEFLITHLNSKFTLINKTGKY